MMHAINDAFGANIAAPDLRSLCGAEFAEIATSYPVFGIFCGAAFASVRRSALLMVVLTSERNSPLPCSRTQPRCTPPVENNTKRGRLPIRAQV